MAIPESVLTVPGNLALSIPGLHIVANFSVATPELLLCHKSFKAFIDERIDAYELSKVGEIYYDFPNGGYTGVACLTESHLSIHTWPEHRYVTFDVFLSNYLKDNRNITQSIYRDVGIFFQATVLFEQIIDR